MKRNRYIMNMLWAITISFYLTTYLVVNIIEGECGRKGNFVRNTILMPSISIHCAPRTIK